MNGNEKSVNLAEICPRCGERKNEKNLICGKCHSTYVEAVGQLFVRTGEGPSIAKWLLEEIRLTYPGMKKEYQEALAMVDRLKESQRKADLDLEVLMGEQLNDEKFAEIIIARREKIWTDGNGNKYFGDMKRLENLIDHILPELTIQLEQSLSTKATATEPAPTQR